MMYYVVGIVGFVLGVIFSGIFNPHKDDWDDRFLL